MVSYIEPKFNSEAFNCPHCDTYSHQKWYHDISADCSANGQMIFYLSVSFCSRCREYAIWVNEKIIYPISSIAPLPVEDMPDDVKEEYLEARNIVNQSPRGASALLRLALQKLMPHLGGQGQNINTDIGSLVKKGLPETIQKALDVLRVIGNESVHPGELDLKDDSETAQALFKVLNIIVEVMIVQPKEIGQLYYGLPDNKKEGIKNRDKN